MLRSGPSRSGTVVFLIEDDKAVREGFTWLLEGASLTVESYATCESFLNSYAVSGHGVIVLDLQIPGMGGQLFIERHGGEIGLPIIVLTAHADVATAVHCVKLGAVEVLTKPCVPEHLLDVVHRSLLSSSSNASDRVFRAEMGRRVACLTRRERDVLQLIVEARNNREIGMALGISHKTVDIHRSNILRKLELDSSTDMIRTLTRLGVA